MTSTTSFDTNCLLRWLLHDLPDQANSVAKILASTVTVHVADQALLELVYVLEKLYRLPRSYISDCLQRLLAEGQLDFNRTLFSELALLYTQHPNLSPTDCYLVLEARQAGTLPLLTFDKQLAKKLSPGAELLIAS